MRFVELKSAEQLDMQVLHREEMYFKVVVQAHRPVIMVKFRITGPSFETVHCYLSRYLVAQRVKT
jgi:hypothetical protein